MNSLTCLKKSWKYRSIALALAIHAVLFFWMFVIKLSPEEKKEIQTHMDGSSIISYAQAIVEQRGPHWLSIILWNGNREVNLYWRLSQLSIKGYAGFWQDGESINSVKRPLPYKDVPVEYQPLGLLSIIIPAFFSSNIDEYFFLLGAWLGVLYVANLFIGLYLVSDGCLKAAKVGRMLWWSIAFLVLFGDIAAARFDHFVVTVMLLAAMLFHRAMKSETRAGLMWFKGFGCLAAIGVLTKIVPGLILLSGLLVLILQGEKVSIGKQAAISSVTGFLIGLILLNVIFYKAFGQGYLDSFLYHVRRGIEIESLYAGILMLAHLSGIGPAVEVVVNYGSKNLVVPYTDLIEWISLALFLVLTSLIIQRVWQRRDCLARLNISHSTPSYRLIVITMVMILAFILTNKVFSPQYLLWIAPLMIVLASARKDWQLPWVIFLLATLLTQLIFPVLWDFLSEFNLTVVFILNVRNLLLVGLLILLIHRLPYYVALGE